MEQRDKKVTSGVYASLHESTRTERLGTTESPLRSVSIVVSPSKQHDRVLGLNNRLRGDTPKGAPTSK
jgi:hypothetical protein